jgi:2-oxoglutarate dehydrogenase E1 component
MAEQKDSRSAPNSVLEETSFLFGTNAAYVEDLYAQYLANPDTVDASWQEFFESLEKQPRINDGPSWARSDWPLPTNGELTSALDTNWGEDEKLLAKKVAAHAPEASADDIRSATIDSVRAIMMIRAFRIRGHLGAELDPLGLEDKARHPELDPATYGFADADMDRVIFIDHVLGLEYASLREILDILRRTYCSTLGYEFMHITDPLEKGWLQERIEGPGKEVTFTKNGKRAILNKLIEAEGFEKFLHVKFTGTKRFGLDGGEAVVPAMEQIIKRGGNLGLEEIVLGMPHRGRLNMLSSVMAKPYRAIFNEFLGGSAHPEDVDGSGDVKYHLGASSDREFDGNKVHLSLTANPSHLEAVNPVVIGKVRAKQYQYKDVERTKVLPVLLHGDAAFAGQGMVAECFGLSGLKGHRTGGTIHVIVNNQIGFTTSPQYSRSSPYPSDVALMVQAPIFHVNGDDPEAVTYAAKIATEFRQKFKKDVVIDMFCYRRHGHNEGDEPMFTQPLMYKKVKGHATTLKIYSEKLIAEGLFTEEEVGEEINKFHSFLEEEFEAARGYRPNKADWLEGRWTGFGKGPGEDDLGSVTAVETEALTKVGSALTAVPEGFNMHRTLRRIIGQKAAMFETGAGFDWATAEALAFGTLLQEGYPVRLSGQDCMRGTFSQRHSGWVDQENEERYYPLNHVTQEQPEFEVIDTMLSEEAVLGFEYGYTLSEPNTLTLWEAQFGDFANGAQVIIDQFIASGERKWLRMSGLVMLLPHGYEGQGPEHSSARLERFLQACAEENMQVVNCTTPANYFHVLRRQLHRKFRKPLIVMTPKSLLRHKKCVSSLADMGPGSAFERVLPDGAEKPGTSVDLRPEAEIKRVVLCSGKVYYDLFEEREKRGIDDIQLIRVEQLYPFPALTLVKELARFPNAEFVWCQEEPKNMGAWSFIEPNIEWVLTKVEAKHTRPHYVGRHATASTATGLMRRHLSELEAFLDEALTLPQEG